MYSENKEKISEPVNHETFRQAIKDHLLEFMPKKYSGVNMDIREYTKINQAETKEGVSIFVKEDQSEDIKSSPVVYLDDMYQAYVKCGNMGNILKQTAEVLADAMEQTEKMNNFVKQMLQGKADDKIIYELINSEKNRNMLANMPHREYMDLSIIYRVVMEINEYGIRSTPITNTLMKDMKLSEEKLFALANENTEHLLPSEMMSAPEFEKRKMDVYGIPEPIADIILVKEQEKQELVPRYVLTNIAGTIGATSLLYKDTIQKFAEEKGTNFYILPNSTTEYCILAEADAVDRLSVEELDKFLRATEIDEENLLSGKMYYYDREAREMSIVGDYCEKETKENAEKENEVLSAEER